MYKPEPARLSITLKPNYHHHSNGPTQHTIEPNCFDMNTTTTTSSSSAIGAPPPPSPMAESLPHNSQDNDNNDDDTTTNNNDNNPSQPLSSPPTAELVTLRPPSKLPSRPRKLRKLSPETSDSSSPKPNTIKNDKIVPRRRITPSIQHPRSLSSEGEVETAIKHLRNSDPKLAKLIDVHSPPTFDSSEPPFLSLAKSILYQQLAYKAGSSIYSRFLALCGGECGVVPETIMSLTTQQLRQIGVSGRKTEYLHDLARKYQNGILSDSSIANMDDKSLFTMLTMVNGIGLWSVHMFMIFSLHRPDVLPTNDLGIRKGVQSLYDLEEMPKPSQMEQLCEKWRPFRSVACWYIWKYAEAQGVPSTSAVINDSATGMNLQPMAAQQHPQQQQIVPLSSPPHQQSQHQHQHQQQFIDPINGIVNLGQLS